MGAVTFARRQCRCAAAAEWTTVPRRRRRDRRRRGRGRWRQRRRCRRFGTQLLEARRPTPQIHERRLLGLRRDVRVGKRRQHLTESFGGGGELLPVERGLRLRVLLLDDRRQHAPPNRRERGPDARRGVAVARKIRSARPRPPLRSPARRRTPGPAPAGRTRGSCSIARDWPAGGPPRAAGSTPPAHRRTPPRRRARAPRPDRRSPARGRRRRQHRRRDEGTESTRARKLGFHFFLKSTLRRAGALSVTVAA